MTIINTLSHARQSTVAFKAQNENQPKKHPGAAVASFLIPGSSQIYNGETKKGLTHLGIYAGLVGAFLGVAGKEYKTLLNKVANTGKGSFIEFFKGLPKNKKTPVAFLTAGSLVPKIVSAIDAYKAKPEKS